MEIKFKKIVILACFALIVITGCVTTNVFTKNDIYAISYISDGKKYSELINNSEAIDNNAFTIAYMSDSRPARNGIEGLVKSLNQIELNSPTKKVDAIIMNGDMELVKQTLHAYLESNAKNIPLFFVVGNHELNNNEDLIDIRKRFGNYHFNPKEGPLGSNKTTYSFNVGDMHVVVINEYWDGDNNEVCNWFVPQGGINTDESCFRYSSSDGGFITDALFAWLENDLKYNTKNWTIVVGHEALFPLQRQIGSSLDENITNRNRLENVFKKYNVTTFIGSHTHFSNVTLRDNIFHIDTGVGSVWNSDGDPFASIIYTTSNSTQFKMILRRL